MEDVEAAAEKISGPGKKVSQKQNMGRLTYAERQQQRQQMEKLEEKRAQAVAAKSEAARKVFLSELLEKKRLEDLKASARRTRIDEERRQRREQEEIQKRIKDETLLRYK